MSTEALAGFILILFGVFAAIGVEAIYKHRNRGGHTSSRTVQSSSSGGVHKTYMTLDGPSGSKMHFDENGNFVGTSMPNVFGGGMAHFDADGNYAGRSDPGLFDGDVIHTDANGDYAGQSTPGLFGNIVHSGKNGETGITDDGALGGNVTDFWND